VRRRAAEPLPAREARRRPDHPLPADGRPGRRPLLVRRQRADARRRACPAVAVAMRARSLPALEALQWFGLFAGPLAFAAEHVLGLGATLARCNPAAFG